MVRIQWVVITSVTLLATVMGTSQSVAADTPKGDTPKVVLIGDSIRLSYAPYVVKSLQGKAQVVSPRANGGDSANVLKHLDEWAIREQPAVVHFNCGIHDIKKFKKTGQFQVSPEAYAEHLRKIVRQLREKTKATVLFALTTPVVDDRAAKGRIKAEYDLLEASAQQYNQIALGVMKELQVPVNDLRAALGDADSQARLVGGDGIHLTPKGCEVLGNAVAVFVEQHLPVATPKASP